MNPAEIQGILTAWNALEPWVQEGIVRLWHAGANAFGGHPTTAAEYLSNAQKLFAAAKAPAPAPSAPTSPAPDAT